MIVDNTPQAAIRAQGFLENTTSGEWSFSGEILRSQEDQATKLIGFIKTHGDREFIERARELIEDLVHENTKMYRASYSDNVAVDRTVFEFQLTLANEKIATLEDQLYVRGLVLRDIVETITPYMYSLGSHPDAAELAHEVFMQIDHLQADEAA